jgi:acyl carrier protein
MGSNPGGREEAAMQTDSRDQLEDRVRGVIVRTFGLPAPQGDKALRMGDPPQWDSLAHMNLVMALEREFGVSFPTYAIAELSSDAKIVDALARQPELAGGGAR